MKKGLIPLCFRVISICLADYLSFLLRHLILIDLIIDFLNIFLILKALRSKYFIEGLLYG